MFKIKIRDILLLTGAGFTKNFGGFLAQRCGRKERLGIMLLVRIVVLLLNVAPLLYCGWMLFTYGMLSVLH